MSVSELQFGHGAGAVEDSPSHVTSAPFNPSPHRSGGAFNHTDSKGGAASVLISICESERTVDG